MESLPIPSARVKIELISELEALFESRADAVRSVSMAAYMKDRFPFYGVAAPERNELIKTVIKKHKHMSSAELEDMVRTMWKKPQREWQYAALSLLIRFRKLWNKDTAGLVRELAEQKSWWDTVDTLSSNCAGPLILKFPECKSHWLHEWEETGNMWLIRMCILHQLSFRNKTDVGYLEEIIKRHAGSDEFFIRKSIGWALRQYGKTNPEWVKSFTLRCKLKPLSLREAIKNII